MGIKKENESVWYELLVIIVGTLIIMLFKTCL
jgi:hypothetical protein